MKSSSRFRFIGIGIKSEILRIVQTKQYLVDFVSVCLLQFRCVFCSNAYLLVIIFSIIDPSERYPMLTYDWDSTVSTVKCKVFIVITQEQEFKLQMVFTPNEFLLSLESQVVQHPPRELLLSTVLFGSHYAKIKNKRRLQCLWHCAAIGHKFLNFLFF